MAIHLSLRALSINERKNAKLHWMPCAIKNNGEAKVSAYFEPIIIKQKDGVLQSSFRGYPLLGKELQVPKNYVGVVLCETNPRPSERNVYGIYSFEKFTYWNWDCEPSADDEAVMAMEWLDIAQALHSPVDS